MNDRPSTITESLAASGLAGAWYALLLRVSRPLRGQSPPDPTPLWVRPGETAGCGDAAYPHGKVIHEVLSRYATALDTPISFRSPASRYSPPAPGNAVHIHAFALPTPPVIFGTWPRVSVADLALAHGIPLGVRRVLALGTQIGRGHPFVDGDGQAVGECLGTNLYFLFDLLAQEADRVPLLLRRHLDLGLPVLLPALRAIKKLAPGEREERLRFLREETEDLDRNCRQSSRHAGRAAYIGACQERMGEELRFLQDEIAFLEDGVEEMARRITSDTRRRRETDRRLCLLQGGPDPPKTDEEELEQLQALADVCEVRAQVGRISLTTNPILAEHGERWYRLGRFQLDLHFSGDIHIVNLTHPVGPYDHPHIHNGRPCLGEIRGGIAKLLGEFQFMAAAEVLIDFLKTVNPADWRVPVLYWPEAAREAGCGVLAAT